MSDRKVISSSLNVNTIEDGTSPYLAVLDNTMDSVACNYQGLVTTEQTIEVNASFYLGSTKQIIPLTNGIVCKINGITLTSSYGASGTIAYNYKAIITNLGTDTAHIVIYVREQTSITSSVDIVVTVSSVVDGETVSQDVVLTINGIKAGQNGESPVIYNCLPNPTNVSVKRTSTGGYNPRYTTVRCGYTKKVGDTQTTVQDASGDIDNLYRVFFRRIARSTGIAENTYYYYNDSTYRYYVLTTGSNNGFDTQTYSGVEFIIYKDTTNSSFAANSLDATKLIDRQTVPVVSDGQSAPSYTKEYYAWSSQETTTDANREPTPNSGWATSIGSQGSYAYLWKKVETYTLSSSGSYSVSTTQYFRMTGESGTSINMAGKIKYAMSSSGSFPQPQASESGNLAIKAGSNTIYKCSPQAPGVYAWTPDTTASDGNAYTVVSGSFTGSYQSTELAGHLVLWSQEAGDWVDLGKFKGENGTTYYTHIVWAGNVTFSGGVVQTITGYLPVKPEGDTEHPWMGVYVDTNSADPTSGDDPLLNLYTWSNTKGDTGDDGDPAAVALATPDKISVPCNVDGGVSSVVSIPMSFSMRIGNTAATNVRVSAPSSMPTGVSYSGSTQNTGTISITTSATATGIAGGVTFTVIGSDGTKDYTATVTVALIGATQGGVGERGKVGRFFYYGGVFDSTNTTKEFVVNDAQVPFFEHTEDNQKRYSVYNPDTNPAGGVATMHDMWQASGGSWSHAPWEPMENSFPYLISEAIFTGFAKLGSFIISGDWMFSQFGVIYDGNGEPYTINSKRTGYIINGVTYNYNNAYLLFDADYPNTSKENALNFCPFLADDGLTGVTYRQRGNIGGFTINSTQIKSTNEKIILNSDGSAKLVDGNFEGVVHAAMMYGTQLTVNNPYTSVKKYAIDLVNHPANLFMCDPTMGKLVIVLPEAGEYDGITIRFFAEEVTASKTVTLQTYSRGVNLYFKDMDNYVVGSWQSSDAMKMLKNEPYEASAINGVWYITQGIGKYGTYVS